MAARRRRGFSWIPREYNTDFVILLNGVDVREHTVSCEFSKAIAPEVGTFVLRLDNNNSQYSNIFKGGETFEVRYDFNTPIASTKRFLGFVEELKEVFEGQDGHVLEVRGSHISGVLSDKTVIRSYVNSTADAIIKDLFSTYFSSFTTNNVDASPAKPEVSWNNIPFWQAVAEIANAAGFVLYVDDDQDVHFFAKGGNINTQEAIVYEDTLIELEGLGTDTIEVRNKIRVHGEVDGLPVLFTSEDSSSQTENTLTFSDGVKERIIDDGNVASVAEAKSIADSELADKKDKKQSGRVTSWFLATLNAGESIWITNPEQKILDKFNVARLTHFLPEERTVCDIESVKTISNLFRDRDLKSVSLEKITNPNDLNFSSPVFSFDNDTLTDVNATDANIITSDGQLILNTGTTGTWISINTTAASDITKVQVKATGEVLQDATFFVHADGNTFEQVTLEELTVLANPGKLLRLRIDFGTANTRVGAAVILYS